METGYLFPKLGQNLWSPPNTAPPLHNTTPTVTATTTKACTHRHTQTHTHNCWAGWATSFYFPPHPSSVADQILLAPALRTLRALTFAHYSVLLSLVAHLVQTWSEVWVGAGAQMLMSDQTEFSPGFCSLWAVWSSAVSCGLFNFTFLPSKVERMIVLSLWNCCQDQINAWDF